jgi:protein-disulfide isomerase
VEANVVEALESLCLAAEIERVEDPGTVKSLGVYVTPAVIIDGDIKVVGKVPSVEEMKGYITEAR